MRSWMRFLAVLATGLGMLATSAKAGSGNGAQAFEKLKSLAGQWESGATGEMKAATEFAVTSGGSAVIERFHMTDGAKQEEMVTMYYLDGDQLKMTHYCTAGNQPTFAGEYDPETRTLTFNFLSATNLKSPNDGHMHHAVYTFVDDNHFKTNWTFQKDQKDAFAEQVTYVRK
jgi:hypothetical protein